MKNEVEFKQEVYRRYKKRSRKRKCRNISVLIMLFAAIIMLNIPMFEKTNNNLRTCYVCIEVYNKKMDNNNQYKVDYYYEKNIFEAAKKLMSDRDILSGNNKHKISLLHIIIGVGSKKAETNDYYGNGMLNPQRTPIEDGPLPDSVSQEFEYYVMELSDEYGNRYLMTIYADNMNQEIKQFLSELGYIE